MKKFGKMTREVLRHVGRKPATIRYPFVKAVTPPQFRGKIKFYYERCIGCKMCERDCPSRAITINLSTPLEAGKVAEKVFEAVFDLDKCIYCAQCVDSCPKQALEATPEFELAEVDKSRFKVIYHAKQKAFR